METITVHTVRDLKSHTENPRKRKNTSKACSSCRKLKIRCRGQETDPGRPTCEHCAKTQIQCSWPEADGRKWRRARSPWPSSSFSPGNELSQFAAQPSAMPVQEPQPGEWVQPVVLVRPHSNQAHEKVSPSQSSQTAHSVVQYYRYLGPTAIAPGYKKISLKVTNDSRNPHSHNVVDSHPNGPPEASVFDPRTGLPRAELLLSLLDAFFEYYGSYFCFLNRRQLDGLIQTDEMSNFLLCSIAALAARFCGPDVFEPYLISAPPSQIRECWEYSLPFLERAKQLLMPLLSIPSRDLVAGLLILALAEFGDNNEAGMWMFTGMATRVAQELGLHRNNPSIYISIGRSPVNDATESHSNAFDTSQLSNSVELQEFERSSQIVLWWCVFVQDTSLANGTGRVPSIKRSEVSIPLPTADDVANIRAGPGGVRNLAGANVFPDMVRQLLEYSRSIEFLNTNHQAAATSTPSGQFTDTVETVRERILAAYKTLPDALSCGAKQYRSASESGQAIPYLLLHLNYYLQIAFLIQASHASELEFPRSHAQPQLSSAREATSEHEDLKQLQKNENELYRKAITSIVHMLTIARFVDARPIFSIFWLNQAFFHAACAYAGDMLRFQGHNIQQFYPEEEASAFPLPSRFSTSVVVDMDEMGETSPSTTATDSYLALLAKTNYQFLRQAIKDMARYYAGAGWVDAVLDQRESGIRDVDLSIVSESISTYIRLHDLHQGGPPPVKINTLQQSTEGTLMPPDDLLSSEDLLSGIFPDFDSQAFFNDYIFTDPSDAF